MKNGGNEGDVMDTWYFQSNVQYLASGEFELGEKIDDEFLSLKQKVFDMDKAVEGSGWTFVSAEGFTIRIVKLKNITMGKFIPFKPRNNNGNILRKVKMNTINVKNENDKCCLYNIILSKFSRQIEGDPSNPKNLEKFMKYINDKGVEYPVTEKDFLALEMNNKNLNISINVWRYMSSRHIEPYFISRNISRGHTNCNMLLIESKEKIDDRMTQHLVHVKDLEALFRESSGSDLLRKKHFCPVCKLYRTATNKKMLKHYKQCRNPNYFMNTFHVVL